MHARPFTRLTAPLAVLRLAFSARGRSPLPTGKSAMAFLASLVCLDPTNFPLLR
ncbi:hypothetical protein QA641_06575 [Bradyrhizobium sp. CB1650]|uniref:hypothetical protein n=1 Tax=Bradyrhizobium sp. CB1650 TaxID=3039153 RepID=UPI002435C206|nr:hypothetical protein [Bradyrhizobium sp. CB1650]WGD56501.1 hypothetical protein QA641_06575 [Bradyrhizobium sp. CB1650]